MQPRARAIPTGRNRHKINVLHENRCRDRSHLIDCTMMWTKGSNEATTMRYLKLKLTAFFLGLLVLSLPSWGTDTRPTTAYPGTLNYVDGQASIGSQKLTSGSIGS